MTSFDQPEGTAKLLLQFIRVQQLYDRSQKQLVNLLLTISVAKLPNSNQGLAVHFIHTSQYSKCSLNQHKHGSLCKQGWFNFEVSLANGRTGDRARKKLEQKSEKGETKGFDICVDSYGSNQRDQMLKQKVAQFL